MGTVPLLPFTATTAPPACVPNPFKETTGASLTRTESRAMRRRKSR
jgi:hypothetical protein